MANLHKLPLDDWRDWRVARHSHARDCKICSRMVGKHRNLLLSKINWRLWKLGPQNTAEKKNANFELEPTTQQMFLHSWALYLDAALPLQLHQPQPSPSSTHLILLQDITYLSFSAMIWMLYNQSLKRAVKQARFRILKCSVNYVKCY